jgi:AraC family transcriptional regulator
VVPERPARVDALVKGQAAVMDRIVEIKTIDPIHAFGMRHIGPYPEIGSTFVQLFEWAAARDLLDCAYRTIAIFYDNPATVAAEALRSDACLVVTKAGAEPEAPTRAVDIPGGPYAVHIHKGPYAELPEVYWWIYKDWLPSNGHEAKNQPAFEEYLNDPRILPPTEWLTAIYVPLKA